MRPEAPWISNRIGPFMAQTSDAAATPDKAMAPGGPIVEQSPRPADALVPRLAPPPRALARPAAPLGGPSRASPGRRDAPRRRAGRRRANTFPIYSSAASFVRPARSRAVIPALSHHRAPSPAPLARGCRFPGLKCFSALTRSYAPRPAPRNQPHRQVDRGDTRAARPRPRTAGHQRRPPARPSAGDDIEPRVAPEMRPLRTARWRHSSAPTTTSMATCPRRRAPRRPGGLAHRRQGSCARPERGGSRLVRRMARRDRPLVRAGREPHASHPDERSPGTAPLGRHAVPEALDAVEEGRSNAANACARPRRRRWPRTVPAGRAGRRSG